MNVVSLLTPSMRSSLEDLGKIAKNSSHNNSEKHKISLDYLKAIMSQSRQKAFAILQTSNDGFECAKYLSKFQDEFITLLFKLAKTQYKSSDNNIAASFPQDTLMLAATGGYGRGMLAPYSDIDLLFIRRHEDDDYTNSLICRIQHFLWDLGFNLGHAVRSPADVIEHAKTDKTFRTSILETRYIVGDYELYSDMKSRFKLEFQNSCCHDFIEHKLLERQRRQDRAGTSRYLLEPDIKNGKGGLHDLYSLFWLGKYVYGVSSSFDLVGVGLFSHDEWLLFRRCERFLWRVRCHLHFLRISKNRGFSEKLSFDVQEELATRLKYRSNSGILAVERFQKHYFYIAKQVGDLTRILCASLEAKSVKALPANNIKTTLLGKADIFKIEANSDFYVEGNRLRAKNNSVFCKDPVNFIRLFDLTGRTKLHLHPETLHLISRSLRYIDNDLRHNKLANKLFISILTELDNPETLLRRANEAGVLGRFVPEFGRIICLIQFGIYHHYTVDEHLLRAVGILHELEKGLHSNSHPLCTSLMPKIVYRRALYAAVFFHDIAKGYFENGKALDHSICGAMIGEKLFPRLGLSKTETKLAVWLIKYHLVMNEFAQKRDFDDLKTLKDFAQIVKNQERLDLLLILTVCDIKAVGPNIWNDWKASLLRSLYYSTSEYIASKTPPSRKFHIEKTRKKLKKALSHWTSEQVEKYMQILPDNYFVSLASKFFISHAELFKKNNFNIKSPVLKVETELFSGVNLLTILAPYSKKQLLILASCCAEKQHSIIDAGLSATKNNLAINTLCLKKRFDDKGAENRSMAALIKYIKTSLQNSDTTLNHLKKQNNNTIKTTFKVKPKISIHNHWSDEFSVVEISCLDHPGILSMIALGFFQAELIINSAHIMTLGEKVVDTFYVTDLKGRKIIEGEKMDKLKNNLFKIVCI